MNQPGYVLGTIVAMALVTFGLRGLPFWAAPWLRRHAIVGRLGRYLPLAIMTVLLVHAGMGAALQNPRSRWHAVLAVAVVMLLQWRWRHPLLSMLTGTALYVVLRNGLLPGW